MLHLSYYPHNLHSFSSIRLCPFKVNLLAVMVASSFLVLASANAETPTTTVTTSGNAASVDTGSYIDGVDGPTVGHFYYLNKVNGQGNKELTLTISGEGPIAGPGNEVSTLRRIYAAATFRSIMGDANSVKPILGNVAVKQENGVFKLTGTTKDYFLTSNNQDDKEKVFTEATGSKDSRFVLNLVMEDGSSITGKFYGGRNDYYGDDHGESSFNTLNVTMGKGSVISAQIMFGGRSAQKELKQSYKGYSTTFNEVYINGSSLTGINAFDNKTVGTADIVSRAGIWGAEGWDASNNFVKVTDATLVGQTDKTRTIGLVGGRGFYSYRLNTGFYDEKSAAFKIESSIANNNIVAISNSHLGLNSQYKFSTDDTFNSNSATQWYSYSVFGGYSAGSAKDNIVAIENSVINGNVYGGFELQNQLNGGKSLRQLHSNVVSLHNVEVKKGHAVYGTATADTVKNSKLDYAADEGQIFFDEGTLNPVNRRRGIVYLAGANTADSIYARYVHFGQYFDPNQLQPGETTNVVQKFYPNYNEEEHGPGNSSDNTGLVRISDPNNSEAIKLGQLVAGSYVLNRTGFHSSLSQRVDNDSLSTNGKHNFWVAAYTNLTNKVDGLGTSLETKSSLFDKESNVRHDYEKGELSLLTHDDGMVFNEAIDSGPAADDHSEALMHQFRYHYDGRVLYLGVNSGKDGEGKDVRAVAIDFDQIKAFRNPTDGSPSQDTKAFGNTAIGIFMNADRSQLYYKQPVDNGDTSTSWEDMTIDIPGFYIYQGGDTPVAVATYGFYKYMHFDGKDQTFDDVNYAGTKFGDFDGKATDPGKEGGIGIKYWLKSIEVANGRQLVLHGLKEGETFERSRYQLSAQVIGNGGLYIADNTSVVIGDKGNPYQKQNLSENQSSYTGVTTVGSNAHLIQGLDNALGSTNRHTQLVEFALDPAGTTNGTYELMGFTQTVGGLNVAKGATVKLSAPDGSDAKLKGETGGELTVEGPTSSGELVTVYGFLEGDEDSKLVVKNGRSSIYSSNENFNGNYVLSAASANLNDQNSLVNALADVSTGSALYFNSAQPGLTRDVDPRSAAFIRAIRNAGEVFLSSGPDNASNLNHVNVAKAYEGQERSVIHYRGLVQGPNNSYVDVVHTETAYGTSRVSFGDDHSKIPVSGIFKEARGEKTLKSEGIPIFVIADKGLEGNQLRLEMQPFGVVAKDNEAYKWIYSLGYNDEEQQRTWVLYNSDDKDYYEPLVPPKEEENLVLRPEAGAYVGASQSWAKMHMRLHDRFGQAYYIDPFDGEEKPVAAWVRQVGSHSHFRMAGGQSKTHSNTAVTQIGGDLLRNEFNEDWKYIGGVFAGGLYNRSDSRSWDSAKSRSDGYSLGVYGTLYTGNSPDDGFYVDSWLLFGRYDNKIWSDEISPFKFKSHGWVWSVETGYTIPIGESGTKDYNKLIWTFQPEAQLVWDGVKANSANDSFGTKYRQLGTDNVTLRVGARLHANYMNKGLGFIEGNWIHNSKKAGVQMGTDKVYMDGGRNLGEFRMGLEGHLGRNTLGWATVGVQAGKSGYHNETAQIGIKYMF